MRALLALLLATSAQAFIIPPGSPVTGATAAANTLYCIRYPSPAAITAASFSVRYTNGGSSSPVGGLAVYDDTGTQLAATSAALSAGSSGNLTITGASVSLSRGGFYRWCLCSTSTGTTWQRTGATSIVNDVSNLINAGNTWFGTGSSPCVAGVPPASISGALTGSTADMVIRVHVLP